MRWEISLPRWRTNYLISSAEWSRPVFAFAGFGFGSGTSTSTATGTGTGFGAGFGTSTGSGFGSGFGTASSLGTGTTGTLGGTGSTGFGLGSLTGGSGAGVGMGNLYLIWNKQAFNFSLLLLFLRLLIIILTHTFSAANPQQNAAAQLTNMATAVSLPLIFGDERDALIAKWNQLQAYWGTGKGFYNQQGQSVDFKLDNPFCRFKVSNKQCFL